MIKKVRRPFEDAVLTAFLLFLAVIGLSSLGILISALFGDHLTPSPQFVALTVLALALLIGILGGAIYFFVTRQIKIRFIAYDGEFSKAMLKLKKKSGYNVHFVSWLRFPLQDLGAINIDKYMSFIETALTGYYRGEKAKDTNKPTWDEIHLFALGLLNHRDKYYQEAFSEIKEWILKKKREEIT